MTDETEGTSWLSESNVDTSEPDPVTVMAGIPSEIKIVIKDKVSTLKTNKPPSIMQVDKSEPAKPAPVIYTTGPIRLNAIPTIEQRQVVTKSAVQYKAKFQNAPETQKYTNNIQYLNYFVPNIIAHSYPAGIPKSFLVNNTPKMKFQAIEKPKAVKKEKKTKANESIEIPSWITGVGTQTVATDKNCKSKNLESNLQAKDTQAETANSSKDSKQTNCETVSDNEHGTLSPVSSKKRTSAFERLGPLAQPKKPKMTINLLFSREKPVREVYDKDDSKEYIPVPKRPEVLSSTDETVIKYLSLWPWGKFMSIIKTAKPRESTTSMLMELEQMENGYDNSGAFIKVTIYDYPKHFKKEDVLDLLLNKLYGKLFIPCFIEMTKEECNFLVLNCHEALIALHKLRLRLRVEDDLHMSIHISLISLKLKDLNFIPNRILRKKFERCITNDTVLNLKEFFLQSDISNFIYFPLNCETNQMHIVKLQSYEWSKLVELNLSYNRISSLNGFCLSESAPKLKRLDLSHNHIERLAALISCRDLMLTSLDLDGNPVCLDYIDPDHYVEVVRMLFPALATLDGVDITSKLPESKQNYCPEDAQVVVTKFLEVFFPLMDSDPDDRMGLKEMYAKCATLTITYDAKLRCSRVFTLFQNLFTKTRNFKNKNSDSIGGDLAIVTKFTKWPPLCHDPASFVVDVMYHSENTTILRIGGIVKMTSNSLADDEPLLSFVRTLVLNCEEGRAEYKIHNDILCWLEPTQDDIRKAFQITKLKQKRLSLKFDTPPNDDLKEKLIVTFMEISGMKKALSERCLVTKQWDFRNALEYLMSLLKLNSTEDLELFV